MACRLDILPLASASDMLRHIPALFFAYRRLLFHAFISREHALFFLKFL